MLRAAFRGTGSSGTRGHAVAAAVGVGDALTELVLLGQCHVVQVDAVEQAILHDLAHDFLLHLVRVEV